MGDLPQYFKFVLWMLIFSLRSYIIQKYPVTCFFLNLWTYQYPFFGPLVHLLNDTFLPQINFEKISKINFEKDGLDLLKNTTQPAKQNIFMKSGLLVFDVSWSKQVHIIFHVRVMLIHVDKIVSNILDHNKYMEISVILYKIPSHMLIIIF